MRISLIAGSIALLGATPLFAGAIAAPVADPFPVAPIPAPAPAYDWSGFSAGVQLGYGDVENEDVGVDGDGALYGLRANYDYDFGSFVLGAGLQYDWADIELDTDAGVTAADVDTVLRAGVRAGFDSGRNLYYLTGGYAKVDLDLAGGGSDDSDGFYYGAGYEVFLTDTVTAGAEILKHEFDNFDGALSGTDAEATTAALSVNFRF